jgi:hypothetical protein
VNPKSAINGVLLLGLVLSGSGCCTASLNQSAHEVTRVRFAPSAVYRDMHGDNFAIQGRLIKTELERASGASRSETADVRHGATALVGGADRRPDSRYLIIPHGLLAREDLWTGLSATNGGPWLDQIRAACPKVVAKARVRDSLPRDYEKVADLPTGTHYLELDCGPHTGRMALVPLAVIGDIALIPVYFIGAAIWVISGAHNT